MTRRDRQPHGRDYQLMVTALAEATRRRDAELTSAEEAYRESAAQAAGELARAEHDAMAADRWAGSAAAQVVEVDREAGRLWDELSRARSIRTRALGDVPEPAPVEDLPRVALPRSPHDAMPEPPREILARAAERIDHTLRPAGRRRALPRWMMPLLPLLGAGVAAVVALVAAVLVRYGADAPVIRTLGWLFFVAAPSAGVPAAAAISHRGLQARLDIGGIGLTLLGGMISATVLSLLFAAR